MDREELLKDFSSEQVDKLDEIIKARQGQPGSLIPTLEEAQVALGYLPVSVLKRISDGLNIPLSHVYGVVTFYSFFNLEPKGRHIIKICMGTACYVKGGQQLVDVIEQEFKVPPGGTTEDRRFTLETVRCIGACGLAPAMLVDEDVYGGLEAGMVKDILANYV